MNHFCLIIDSRRGHSRLGRCLRAITEAASSISGHLDTVLIVDKPRARLTTLAEHHGARLVALPAGPRGQRYNTCANATLADALVFIDPLAELPADWLACTELALFDRQWDAVTLTTEGWPGPAWLERLYRPGGRTLALAIKRHWFERVGGFDPDRDTGAERDLIGRLVACHARVLHRPRESDKTA